MAANISYIEDSASSLVMTEGVVGCTALPADVPAAREHGEDVVLLRDVIATGAVQHSN